MKLHDYFPARLSRYAGFFALGLLLLGGSLPARAQFSILPAAQPEPGYLGLIADDRNEQGEAVRVVEVLPNSPAAQAGLKAGDRITLINGRAIHKMEDLGTFLTAAPAGTKLRFEVVRAMQTISFDVTLGQRPVKEERSFPEFGKIPDPPATGNELPAPRGAAMETPRPANRPLLGVQTTPVTEANRLQLGLPAGETGAYVVSITNGSPAQKAGLPLGCVIVGVDNRRVRTPDELAALVQQAGAGREVEIAYLERGQLQRKKVVLGEVAMQEGPVVREFPGSEAAPNYPAPPRTPPQPITHQPSNPRPRINPAQPDPPSLDPPPADLATPPLLPPQPIQPQSVKKPAVEEASRVGALEVKIRQLEQRVAELESLLKAKSDK